MLMQSILVGFERLDVMLMQLFLVVIERLGSQQKIAAAVDSRVFRTTRRHVDAVVSGEYRSTWRLVKDYGGSRFLWISNEQA